MKRLVIYLLICISLNSYAQLDRAEKWKADIEYMNKRLEITHPNLYSNISKEDYNLKVQELCNRLENLNDAEITLNIMKLLESFRDGHTELSLVKSGPEKVNELFHLFPFILYPFEDGVYVLSTLKEYKTAVGAKVLKIGNLPVEQCMAKIYEFIPADNIQGKKSQLPYLYFNNAELLKYIGAIDNTSEISLTLQAGDKEEVKVSFKPKPFFNTIMGLFRGYYPTPDKNVVTMNQESKNQLPLYLSSNTNKPSAFPYFTDFYWYKNLPKHNAIYLQLNVNEHKEKENFNEFCKNLFKAFDKNKSDILIIDLRQNNGGDHIEMPLLKGVLERPELNKPDKLFILTSRFTFSASQHLVTLFKTYTNSTLIGEATSGKPNFFGAVNTFSLPYNEGIVIATSSKYWQDGDPRNYDISTYPDIYIPLKSVDYKNNIDPVIEAAFNYENYVQLENTLIEKLKKSYLKDGIDGFKSTYAGMKGEYLGPGLNMEKVLFYKLDYWVAENRKNKEEYIEYLSFLHKEFPECLNVMTDLGSWLEVYGTQDEAKELYQKCIEINPSHRYAKMKLELMKLENLTNKK